MDKSLIPLLYLLIISHLNKFATSVNMIDVKDIPETDLERNFENEAGLNTFLPEFNDEIPRVSDYNDIENRNSRSWIGFTKLNLEDNSFGNKILVKRPVPHGIAPTGVEYDHVFDTAYIPIARVHKSIPINKFYKEVNSSNYDTPKKDIRHGSVIFILSNKDEFKPKYDLGDDNLLKSFEGKREGDLKKDKLLIKVIQKNIDDFKIPKLLSPSKGQYNKFHSNDHELRNMAKNTKYPGRLETIERFKNSYNFKDSRLDLVKQIQKRIVDIKSKSARLVAYAKVISALSNILRSPKFEKSGEENDPFAPGKQTLQEEEKQKQPKKWIPHYPPWNYWTYKKTIHEDVCPGTQVKIGNMCVWTPPH